MDEAKLKQVIEAAAKERGCSVVDITLDDAYSTWQVFELSRPVDTTYVRITVNSVYPGSQWDDTAISDIQVY